MVMETTMTVNVEIVGIDDTKKVVRSMTQDRKRGHVAIWQEILRDARIQWIEAEHGKLHKMVGNDDTKEMVRSMTQDKKRGHVAIWQEILRDVRKQWTEAEYGN
jgi:L-rhamnose mutarotase